MAARNYSNIAVATTLSTGIGSGDTSLVVASATGWPTAPFILVIEPGTGNEELILVGAKTGTTFSTLTRGFGGTSAIAHNAGAEIEHVSVAEDYSLIWSHQHTGAGGDDTTKVVHSDLDTIGADDHHAQDHAARHSDGGADELAVEGLPTADLDVSRALRPDGAGGLAFSDVAHADTTGQGTDDHHPQNHAARHLEDGADALGWPGNFEVDNFERVAASTTFTGSESWTTIANTFVTIPAEWTTWKATVWAFFRPDVDGDFRIDVGGFLSATTTSDAVKAKGMVHRKTGSTATGAIAVLLQFDPVNGGSVNDITLYVRAVRTS